MKQEWLQRVVECSLSAQNVDAEVELGLLIADDQTVRELNRRYRGIDQPTDVLSFALSEEEPAGSAPPFVSPPDGLQHLGEVIISYPQAVRQAEERDCGIEKEIALLVVHGMLHLTGYEHDEPAREQEMRALEEKILSKIGR